MGKELDDARQRIAKLPTEEAVRRLVKAINVRIAKVNATTTSGPASTLVPLDIERIVARWKSERD